MEYFVWVIPALIVLLIFSFIFIKLNRYAFVSKKIKIVHRQSDNHIFLKQFLNHNQKLNNKTSQSKKREDDKTLKVLFTDENKAYWINNNIFYVSEIINGIPDFENAQQINTENMSKTELDKMLFILDNLRRGDKNERGSSGN